MHAYWLVPHLYLFARVTTPIKRCYSYRCIERFLTNNSSGSMQKQLIDRWKLNKDTAQRQEAKERYGYIALLTAPICLCLLIVETAPSFGFVLAQVNQSLGVLRVSNHHEFVVCRMSLLVIAGGYLLLRIRLYWQL